MKFWFSAIKWFATLALLVILGEGCKIPPAAQKAPVAVRSSSLDSLIEILEGEPAWLFTANSCPAETMAVVETSSEFFEGMCSRDPISCLRTCENNGGNECYALAVLLDHKFQNEKPHKGAIKLHARACRLGLSSGCTNAAASLLFLNLDDREAQSCALATFRRTCARNDPWGCTMFAEMVAAGNGLEGDEKQARKGLEKSCQFGDEDPACSRAKELEKQFSNLPTKKR